MDGKKKSTEGKTKGKSNYKIFSIILADLLIAAIIQDVYFLLTDCENFLAINITSVVVLLLATLLGLCILGIIGENKKATNAYYNNEMKALRAIYLMMKKNHGVVESTQKETEDAINKISREIVLNQKASSKVVVSRNKENTDALMNSNDIIIEKLLNLMADIKENQNVAAIQNERMTALADSLSDISNSLSNGTMAAVPTPEPVIPELDSFSEMKEEPVLDETVSVPEEPVSEEEFPNLDEMFDLSDLDLSGFEEESGDVVLTGLDELMPEEPELEEDSSLLEDMSDLDALLQELNGSSEEPVSEELPEIPDMPDLADIPVMEEEPLDLSAFDEMLQMPTEEPAAEEPIPAPVEEPVVEEIPASPVEEPKQEEPPLPEMASTPVSMGDMDSNEKLTPEQIAELIASMGN